MSCSHPLKAFPIGKTATGKTEYKITSYKDVDFVYYNGSAWIPGSGVPGVRPKVVTDWIEIPCGQCIGCRLDHAREWAARCMVEADQYPSNFFITLTYDDVHVPLRAYGSAETGEAIRDFTLQKKDLQDFWKRLRESSGQRIRYFACGEYGDQSFRPHYHAIVFNLVLDDLKRFGGSTQYPTFTSDFLTRVWSKGHVLVAAVTFETCSYVARYVTKKATGKLGEFYDYYNIDPEFLVMSRRPGIGRNFFDKKLFENDYITYATQRKGIKFKPPRYFKKLLELEDPDLLEEVNARNKLKADLFKAAKLSEGSYSYLEALAIEERNYQKSHKLGRGKL